MIYIHLLHISIQSSFKSTIEFVEPMFGSYKSNGGFENEMCGSCIYVISQIEFMPSSLDIEIINDL